MIRTVKMKSNVTKWKIAKRIDPPMIVRFECPLCKKIVLERDFITSYRIIEDSNPPSYQIKNLCRVCRDSGL
jgi:hypothetical protein